MASYKCPHCGESYNSSLPACPVCGFETGAYTVETFFGHEPEKNRSSAGHSKPKSRARRAVPVICFFLLACAAVLAVFFFIYVKPMDSYNFAVTRMLAGDYAAAEKEFTSLGDFKDSAVLAQSCSEKRQAEEDEAARIAALEKAYAAALKLMEQEKYEKAKEAFDALEDYSDSAAKGAECVQKIHEQTYNEALALLNEGNLSEALLTFGNSGGYGDAEAYCEELTEILELSDAIAGLNKWDSFSFGTYEGAPIEWIVTENNGKQVTMLSKNILFTHAFNTTAAECDWESCALRAYLNSDFLSGSFSETEQQLMAQTDTTPDVNTRFPNTNQGQSTADKVRLLSFIEYDGLYQDNAERIAVYGNWWLRTMGSTRRKVCFINGRGVSDVGGCTVETTSWGVRPVITLNIY